MIERTYGHLVADSDDRVRARLDARARRVTNRLDVIWTPESTTEAVAANGNPPFTAGS